jgi:hypothetical protein
MCANVNENGTAEGKSLLVNVFVGDSRAIGNQSIVCKRVERSISWGIIQRNGAKRLV